MEKEWQNSSEFPRIIARVFGQIVKQNNSLRTLVESKSDPIDLPGL
ncbi:MAG: hypothetical protein ACR5KV_05325 [Wolbachia sp.]